MYLLEAYLLATRASLRLDMVAINQWSALLLLQTKTMAVKGIL
jgi:hypothetical protein